MHNVLYFNNNRHMIETTMRVGNVNVYGFLSLYKDLANCNLNQKIILRNECIIHKEIVPRSLLE